IGTGAFSGDKKLKSLQIRSGKLKTVGKNALKGIAAKAVLKVPAAKIKAYTKLFKGKGQKKTVKVKK
ncbi:MAG TPA: cell surface protein, partial [Lachnospiraceae bacterium]|nr:cell surface protein [Lachnospiraceae bacterium]